MPPFENVVAEKMVMVSPEQMTCGVRSLNEYCIQTHGIYRECDVCDETKQDKRHPPDFLTDIHTDFNETWWQSVTMLEDVHVMDTNLTVNLGEEEQRLSNSYHQTTQSMLLPLFLQEKRMTLRMFGSSFNLRGQPALRSTRKTGGTPPRPIRIRTRTGSRGSSTRPLAGTPT